MITSSTTNVFIELATNFGMLVVVACISAVLTYLFHHSLIKLKNKEAILKDLVSSLEKTIKMCSNIWINPPKNDEDFPASQHKVLIQIDHIWDMNNHYKNLLDLKQIIHEEDYFLFSEMVTKENFSDPDRESNLDLALGIEQTGTLMKVQVLKHMKL